MKRRTTGRSHANDGRTGLMTRRTTAAATNPASVPATSDHTPAPRYAAGTVTQNVTTGPIDVMTLRRTNRISRYGIAAGSSRNAVEKIVAARTVVSSHNSGRS